MLAMLFAKGQTLVTIWDGFGYDLGNSIYTDFVNS